MVLAVPVVIAQGTVISGPSFNPVTRTGNLNNVDPGAIINNYMNPPVENTYQFISPETVGTQKENPSDVINVEKMDAFGKIIVNP